MGTKWINKSQCDLCRWWKNRCVAVKIDTHIEVTICIMCRNKICKKAEKYFIVDGGKP